ncbi:MAG: branched-chain amino acid ABC transporter permease [Rubrivivax sp.]|nr:branched-chain amino acid ABC transporter permease [Rubrivivax sp.]
MSTFVLGLSLACLLFILAAGLTLIFGMLGVINFAHGSLYMVGAYASYQAVLSTGSFVLGLLAACLLAGAVGLAMEYLALRRLYQRSHVDQLLLTFGCILVIESATRVFWGQDYKQVAVPGALAQVVEWGDDRIPTYRLFIVAVAVAVSALLFGLLERTRLGLMVRAASVDADTAATLGVRVASLRTLVFVGGAALAGFGGAMAAPLVPLELGMGFGIVIDCFIVVIIGGLGNIRGAILAALLIGMTRAIGFRFAPDWVEVATFTLLIATLLIRPQGLFARKERKA